MLGVCMLLEAPLGGTPTGDAEANSIDVTQSSHQVTQRGLIFLGAPRVRHQILLTVAEEKGGGGGEGSGATGPE